MLNLLTENLIRVTRTGGQTRLMSLPQAYATLMADQAEAFPAMRPHQRHAWHAFLVQLGTMAICRAGLAEPPSDADGWRDLIRALTPEWPGDEPWLLAVDDITAPAFMQPPAGSKGREKEYKDKVATPDELDILITSKNHDLKSQVVVKAGFDDWIFALVTLQTMEGFGGAGNYGISRMNGGLGNRPAFSLAPASQNPGPHVRRDIIALLEIRPTLMEEFPTTGNGAGLLWIIPWDGTTTETLSPNRLDPFYIEICRRIRLRHSQSDGLSGIRATSKASRIEGKALKGRTGDPWTPVNANREGLPLTLSAGGFTYKRVTDYLTLPEWKAPALLKATQSEKRSDDGMQLVARAMVRGNGKTEGYHERIIPIRHKAKSAMQSRDGTEELGRIAKSRIDEVGKIQRILSHAIQTFLTKGENEKATPEQRALARAWLNRLDEIVDARFFDDLQTEFEADTNERAEIRRSWLNNGNDGVIDHATTLFYEATQSLPCSTTHRYKAQVKAEELLKKRLRGNAGVPHAFTKTN